MKFADSTTSQLQRAAGFKFDNPDVHGVLSLQFLDGQNFHGFH